MNKLITMLIGALFITSCANTKQNISVTDETLLIASSRFIVMGNLTDSFTPDDDPMTVQTVFIGNTSNTKSWVSDDGQVIYINTKYEKTDPNELILESTRKRLALMNK